MITSTEESDKIILEHIKQIKARVKDRILKTIKLCSCINNNNFELNELNHLDYSGYKKRDLIILKTKQEEEIRLRYYEYIDNESYYLEIKSVKFIFNLLLTREQLLDYNDKQFDVESCFE